MRKFIISLLIIVAAAVAAYFLLTNKSAGVEYTNRTYGFSVSLPPDWSGFKIATSTWDGLINAGAQGEVASVHGPLISIRNPKWTESKPYQDIPIMVFTISQWNDLQNDKFHIGAAPIGPGELGRNDKYVFALPARYNYAYPTGWEEVQSIIDSKPFHTF